MSILETLLPLSDAADKVHIAEKTLRNWRSQGLYPQIFVKLGGKVFVDMGEVEKIIKEQKATALNQLRRLRLD